MGRSLAARRRTARHPFALAGGVPVQSWTTATWPDGSVKWSAHAIGPQAAPAGSYELIPGAGPAAPQEPVTVTRDGDVLRVSTGPVAWALSGTDLITSVTYGGAEIAREVRLVSLRQDTPDEDGSRVREPYTGRISRIVVEQDGPVRAVVRLEGRHVPDRGPAGDAGKDAGETLGKGLGEALGKDAGRPPERTRPGCRSPCACTSTPGRRTCASCTPSSGTATPPATSSPGWACGRGWSCATRSTTGTSGWPARRASSPRPSGD
nr:hypothetical protein GCM10020093_036210 [Planobispora longispora]